MSDATVITDEKKDESAYTKEDRDKSFHQILQEQQQARVKAEAEPVEEKVEEPTVDEEAKKAEEAKALEDKQKQEDERQANLASKAAAEVLKKQEEEKQKEVDKLKAEETEKARLEALKPAWQKDPNATKDANGNPLPKSYEEMHSEDVRIAKELAKKEVLDEIDAREKAKQEIATREAQTKQQQADAAKAASDALQSELDRDLSDLYMNNKLPKIKDQKDENDPGMKEYRNLFETAQRVNAERIAKGEAPIRSIKLIYYEHYKPLEKPAGHDAPVMGAESPLSKTAPEDDYVPSRDRNKSMGQILKEEAAKAAKRLNIRSN